MTALGFRFDEQMNFCFLVLIDLIDQHHPARFGTDASRPSGQCDSRPLTHLLTQEEMQVVDLETGSHLTAELRQGQNQGIPQFDRFPVSDTECALRSVGALRPHE